jgi:hypothetical protein
MAERPDLSTKLRSGFGLDELLGSDNQVAAGLLRKSTG